MCVRACGAARKAAICVWCVSKVRLSKVLLPCVAWLHRLGVSETPEGQDPRWWSCMLARNDAAAAMAAGHSAGAADTDLGRLHSLAEVGEGN